MPRGRALGVTMFLPEQDRYSQSKEFLEGNIASLFGGRIAEALVFGPEKVTTGASNDIMRSTELARNMVTKWGLSEKLGPLTYSEEQDEIFLGHSVAQHKAVSDETAHDIDSEIRVIIDRAYKRAENILKENLDKLHLMADALMKFETIDSDQIDDIMSGKPPRPPQDWDDSEPTASSGGPAAGSLDQGGRRHLYVSVGSGQLGVEGEVVVGHAFHGEAFPCPSDGRLVHSPMRATSIKPSRSR